MPHPSDPKAHVHPHAKPSIRSRVDRRRRAKITPHAKYVELCVTSNFTFLTGAGHPDEFVQQAADLGYPAIAITDHNTLAGIVRAHVAAKEAGIPLVIGCRLLLAKSTEKNRAATVRERKQSGKSGGSFRRSKRLSQEPGLQGPRRLKPAAQRGRADQFEPARKHCSQSSDTRLKPAAQRMIGAGSELGGLSLLVYPTSRAAYGRLCRLLTRGKRRTAKGRCSLTLGDLIEHNEGLLAIVLPADQPDGDALETLRDVFDDDRLSLAVTRLYEADDRERMRRTHDLARRFHLPLVAVNDVHYHRPERRALQDVLTCIRHGCTLAEAGFRLFPHGERYLKPPEEMARLFTRCPGAVARTLEIAERASTFSLDQLRYEYPDETCPPGLTPMDYLKKLTGEGAIRRYPHGVPDKVRREIEHEFTLIEELGYAPYFLTVHDLVCFARSRGILCQGRGAAANSAVCFCLGVTAVDPNRIDVLFERFVSRERREPPDIDIDFEHQRREEVIQYIYAKYGRDRAGLTAEVITYRRRSAVRDVGKALGLSLDAVDRIAKRVDRWEHNPFADSESGDVTAQLQALGFDPDSATMRRLITLVRDILGFPRHLSQHVGGFVITRGPLSELVPIENAAMPNRTVIEWDKDDIDALGMLKVDVLGLGMLTCLRKGLELLDRHHGRKLTLATIPAEDPAVYDMLCEADTVGVFQVESRAQMTMLPRLKPRCFYDLVIEVAIVRPGPIIGDMVHPYLRRRNGEETPHYPDAVIREVLGKTLGVPLFQEQVMTLAIRAAGFSPDEAEQLRRAITAWTSKDKIIRYTSRFIQGMLANGYERSFAEWCFKRLKGFSQYGFPESHAASFALLVYASAWLKRYDPAVFAAALLNSQPLGFYAPAQIVRDAREHGVVVRPVDVNHSDWDCTLEDNGASLRLGMRMVKGMRQDEAKAVVDAVRASGPFATALALWQAAGVSAAALRALARADALGSMHLDRQHALWQLQRLPDRPRPLLDRTEPMRTDVGLPPIEKADQVSRDYHTIGLSLKAHPLSFLRPRLARRGVVTAVEVKEERRSPHGRVVTVAGVVLFRQRPGTAKGVMFMTLEDETGRVDLIVRPPVYERYREAAVYGRLVLAVGRVERRGRVVHVLASAFENIEPMTMPLPHLSRDFR